MGIESEIEIDKTKCQRCGALLSESYGGKRSRELIRETADGDLCLAIVYEILCRACSSHTEIWYAADVVA